MPAVFQKTVEQDLHKPLKIQYCADTVFTKDNTGNLINVLLFEDGVPYNGGGTVSATAIRADGATESWAGTISGNTVSVALTRAALDVPGTLQVFIKVTAGTVETTVYAGVYNVVCTETPTVVAPVTPSDVAALIASIEAAIRNIPADWTSFLGTIAPTFDPGKADGYAAGAYVWYPGQPDNVGTLYRFTSAHSGTWTGTDVVTVVIGNELNDTVRYTAQVHTDEQKTVARSNIGAASADQLSSLGYQVSVNTTDIDVIQRTIGSGLDPNNTIKSQLDGIKADIGTVPDGQNLQGEVSDLKSAIDDSIAESLTWTDGGYTKAYDTIESSSGYSYSSYIDVIPGHKYLVRTKIGGDASITFRDANNAGLAARFKNSESDPNYYNIITIPENAAKMRISCVKANKSTALVAHIYPDEIAEINERLATSETAIDTLNTDVNEFSAVVLNDTVLVMIQKAINWTTGDYNNSTTRIATNYFVERGVYEVCSSSIDMAAYVWTTEFQGVWTGSAVQKNQVTWFKKLVVDDIKAVAGQNAKVKFVARYNDNSNIEPTVDAIKSISMDTRLTALESTEQKQVGENISGTSWSAGTGKMKTLFDLQGSKNGAVCYSTIEYNGSTFKNCNDDISPCIFDGAGIIGANHGYYMVFKATLANHGLTNADIGKTCTIDGNTWVLLQINSASEFTVCCVDNTVWYGANPNFGGSGQPAVPTTYNFGTSITVTSMSALSQLYPSIKNKSVDILRNNGNVFAVGESYDIINLKDGIAKIIQNVGNNDSNSIANLADPIMTFRNVYEFHANGSVTIYENLKVCDSMPVINWAEGTQSISFGTNDYFAVPMTSYKNFSVAPSSDSNIAYFSRSTWDDETKPPIIYIQIDNAPATATKMMVQGVIMDDRNGAIETYAGRIHSTRKMYPYAIAPQSAGQVGETYDFSCFRIPIKANEMSAQIKFAGYCKVSNDYYFFAYHPAAVNVSVPVPYDLVGKTVTEVLSKNAVCLNSLVSTSIDVKTTGDGYLLLRLT